MNALVSIIVPVYGTEKFLPKCMDRLMAQTYSFLEILLVEDGSPDTCGELCDRYTTQDSRVRVIHKPNGGVSSARNAGLAQASGTYIAFVDSDDLPHLDLIEHLLGLLHMHPDCHVAAVGHRRVRPDGSYIAATSGPVQEFQGEECLLHVLKDYTNLHSPWGKLYYRADLTALGLTFDEEIAISEDFLFNYLLALAYSAVCLDPTPHYDYVIHEGSAMSDLRRGKASTPYHKKNKSKMTAMVRAVEASANQSYRVRSYVEGLTSQTCALQYFLWQRSPASDPDDGKEILSCLRRYAPSAWKTSPLRSYARALISITCVCPRAAGRIWTFLLARKG